MSAADSTELTDLTFWQALLAADLSAGQRLAFLENLIPGVDRLAALRTWPGLTSSQKGRIDKYGGAATAHTITKGIGVIEGQTLPSGFCGLTNVPPCLFVHGNALVLESPCVGVVGTRRASSYGKACAYKFSAALAKAGATIVSGGALGVDTEAHKGALSVGGATVAVFGTGVDVYYPSSNQQLFRQIRETGLLASPFALGTPSFEQNFLRRNPVIAALSTVLLVIEAPERSGSLSTATAALEYGRDVYVVPGPVTLQSFRGSHQLIREGATLIDHPDQLIEILGLTLGSSSIESALDPLAELVLACLGGTPQTGEAIGLESGLETSEVMTTLTLLEIDGLVRRDGQGYIRV